MKSLFIILLFSSFNLMAYGKPIACFIEKHVDGNDYEFQLLGEEASEIELIILKNGKKEVQLDLKATHLLLGGYKFEGREYRYLFGWKVSASLFLLNKEGIDFSFTAKKNSWGKKIEGYKFCNY